jgi:hypothetical protein
LQHAGLAPPPDQGHALLQYAKSRGHDIAAGVEILVGAPGSTVSSTRSRKRPNDEELVEQITSGESCTLVDEPAGGTRLTAAGFMATSPMNPQLSKLVGAGLEMFESGAGSSCVNGFGRKFFDDQSTAVTTTEHRWLVYNKEGSCSIPTTAATPKPPPPPPWIFQTLRLIRI